MAERRRRRALMAALVPLLAVLALPRLVDLGQVASRLGHLEPRWIAAYLALSLPLYLLYAWRWWFTAARVGAPLTFRRAWLDYYASTLLNQLLPVGVAGDVARGVRHHGQLRREAAEREGEGRDGEGRDVDTRDIDSHDVEGRQAASRGLPPAATAILLERFSGLVGLALFVVASALAWLGRGRRELVPVGMGALAVVLVGGVVAARLLGRRPAARAALLGGRALAFQVTVSTAAVAVLVALFTCAGRAAGAPLGLGTALAVVPLVLAVGTLPWAFGGWGAREATMAALYRLLGLDAATGVTVSVAFGLLGLLAAAPGLVVLALPRGRA